MFILDVQQPVSEIITISVLAFLLIILLLVVILLIAKAKLLPSGEVNININDEEEHHLTVSPGNTLLSTLQNNKILLPSACGGSGTCGLCECEVLEGAGEILPTEKPFFIRKEI